MDIGCVYSVDDTEPVDRPLSINSIPFGIAYVATSLKKSGYIPHILVFTPDTDIRNVLITFINEFKPKLFCLTAVTSQYLMICRIANEIKKINPDIFILLGGVYATLNPEVVIINPDINAVCIGEGEKAVIELSQQIFTKKEEISAINNLWIKKTNGMIEKNNQDPFIEKIDSLPYIDREMWHSNVHDLNNTEQSILISRGCPNRCTYCSNHALSKISNGKYVRFRSPHNILQEIDEILKQYPHIQSIWLESETLSVNLDYCYELLKSIENFNKNRETPIKFRTNLSLTKKIIDNEDFFIRLQNANFEFVNVGLESGSEKIRNNILKRPPYSNEEIIRFCQMAKKYNINVLLFVMMGLPEETIPDYYQTIDCLRKCSPEAVSRYIYYPYPGTDLYNFAQQKGLISNPGLVSGHERCIPTLNLPHFSKMRIRIEYILFHYRVFHGKNPMRKIIFFTYGNICQSFPRIFDPINRILRKILHKRYGQTL